LEEEEIERSPMEKTRPPLVPESPVPVIEDDEIRRLIRACEGKDFEARRDLAIIRLLLDTGMRRAELLSLKVEDIDLDSNEAEVLGKGRRKRRVPFGRKTTLALDRYIRARAKHRYNESNFLWIAQQGRLGDTGLRLILKTRGEQAGIPNLNPHRFRHSMAHLWLARGGSEGDLMRITGWKSREMLNRYGASAADQRAKEAHKRLGIGDDF
jgi:integrase